MTDRSEQTARRGDEHVGLRPLVYLAGPYSLPDPLENVQQSVALADELLHEGFVVPLVPHLTHLWDQLSPKTVEHWYAYDLELLARCDALLRLPGESVGADREVDFAQRAGIPVFHSKAQLYAWAAARPVAPDA